ncbi:MAG: FAD-dependent oxidoreductase, partial [Candidatus Nezhaarchaeales archaeon]
GYEEFYREARRGGVVMMRGLPSEIRPREGGGCVMKVFDEATDKLLRLSVDLVVLEAGLVLSKRGARAAEVFGLERSGDGFLAEADPRVDTWSTKVPGVFIAGACHSPKDVAEAVCHARAASLAAVAYAAGRA